MKFISALTSVLLAVSPSALADSFSYSLSLAPEATEGSGFGNSLLYSQGGLDLTVSAFSDVRYEGTLSAAQVLRYQTGLGVSNPGEGVNSGSPQHQLDNEYSWDFMLFEFSGPVDLQSLRVDPFGEFDRDVIYFAGYFNRPLDLLGVETTELETLFPVYGESFNRPSSEALTVNLKADGVNTLLIAGPRQSGKPDYYKVQGIKGEISPIPEPTHATLLLLGGALLALRRKRAC
ncbi:MAG: PEP-CTERM sorting domain-containing protein [Verrucomicrobiota bacterium]